MPVEKSRYLLEWDNMAFSCSLQTALQRTQHSQRSAGEVIRRQWVAAYIILFATVPSESAFHNRGLKTGADSGFLLLQPDIVNKTKSLALLEMEQMGRSVTVVSEVYLRRAASFASCSAVAQGYSGHRDEQRNNFLQPHSEGGDMKFY